MIESTSIRLNQAVVAGTDMIGVMIYDAAWAYARAGELAILPVKLSSQPPHIGVITRTSQVSRALGTFLAALRAQCKGSAERYVQTNSISRAWNKRRT